MIELIKLKKCERINLLRKVEPFFVCAKKPKPFLPLHTKIRKEVGNKYSLEIWCILTGCIQAVKHGNTLFRLPLRREAYTHIRKHTKQDISYTKMKRLLPLLESLKYITLYKGYYRNEDDSSGSFISIDTKLLKMLPEDVCKQHGQNRRFDIVEIFETIKTRDSKGKLRKSKKNVPTQGKRGLSAIREGIVDYNKLLSLSNITIDSNTVDNIVYKRVFYKDLTGAGRWYVNGTFQTERSELRETITINGNPTCEIDIKAIQPSILYSWSNKKKPENYDPYKITSYSECDPKELRSFCKVALMCILFSESKRESYKAIKGKLEADIKDKEPAYKSLHNVINPLVIRDELLKRNSDISDYFFSGELWAKLQHTDSSIATFIIEHFTSKDICVLNYHDSWVIESRYKQELIDVMEAAWEHVVGDGGMNFGYDVEFYNKPEFRLKTY